ncbi:MAG: SWIM zinc finger family protein [Anaerolineaceae bacterium]|nr:SWIM zinc finger family protein [Anaerolineaceae bacterium]
MDYGMIGKIEKAKRYAEERDRITFNSLAVEFKGNNNFYEIRLNGEGWQCSCPGFQSHAICPHVMTMERLFKPMLKRDPLPYAPGQNVVSDVEKSKRYSEETDRIQFTAFDVTFHGSNNDHHTKYHENAMQCDCDFFNTRRVCSHSMAMERILLKMLPKQPATEE